MKELTLTEQQFRELAETYGMRVEGLDFYLNIETGEVVALSTYGVDEENEELKEAIDEGMDEVHFWIPHVDSNEGYRDMEDFAETVADDTLRSALFYALGGGKRVFRRFKDELSVNKQELDRYYLFVENRNRERVVDWLESIEMKVKIV